jgi:peptidoglycan/xylan/chitin deacetylase (PgdA/CDA1 family)
LKECAEVIAPILYRKWIPATFFINPAFIDNKELFHRYKGSLLLGKLLRDKIDVKQFLADNNFDGENLLKVKYSQKAVLDNLATKVDLSFTDFLKMQKPYLTMHQLSGLQNKGFSIGAHSWDHPEFWLISEEEQISQIRNSVDWVKDKMNPKHLVFSFPYTDDQCSVELFERMRNENIYNLSFGTAGIKYDEFPTHLQRFPCETKFPLPQQLKTELVYSYLRKFAGKHVVKHNAKN